MFLDSFSNDGIFFIKDIEYLQGDRVLVTIGNKLDDYDLFVNQNGSMVSLDKKYYAGNNYIVVRKSSLFSTTEPIGELITADNIVIEGFLGVIKLIDNIGKLNSHISECLSDSISQKRVEENDLENFVNFFRKKFNIE